MKRRILALLLSGLLSCALLTGCGGAQAKTETPAQSSPAAASAAEEGAAASSAAQASSAPEVSAEGSAQENEAEAAPEEAFKSGQDIKAKGESRPPSGKLITKTKGRISV